MSRPIRATRRVFLGAGMVSSLGALSRLAAVPAAALTACGEPRGPGGGRLFSFFSDWEADQFSRIAERMVDTGHPTAPGWRDTDALATVDSLLAGLDPALSGDLPLALRLVEYGPIVFDATFTRFSRMDEVERDASLEAWMTSRLTVRRVAFTALRNLAFFGYYSQDSTWSLIGYRGPLLARPPTAGATS